MDMSSGGVAFALSHATMEGKITKVGPGAMMYCAGNTLHGVVNTGETPLVFYFYKWLAA